MHNSAVAVAQPPFWLMAVYFGRLGEYCGNNGAAVYSVSQRAKTIWSLAIRGSNLKNLNWCQNKPILKCTTFRLFAVHIVSVKKYLYHQISNKQIYLF